MTVDGMGRPGDEGVRERSQEDESPRGQSWGGVAEEEDDHSEAFGELNGIVGTIDGAGIRGGRSTQRERGLCEEEEEVRLVAEEEVLDFVKVSRQLGRGNRAAATAHRTVYEFCGASGGAAWCG